MLLRRFCNNVVKEPTFVINYNNTRSTHDVIKRGRYFTPLSNDFNDVVETAINKIIKNGDNITLEFISDVNAFCNIVGDNNNTGYDIFDGALLGDLYLDDVLEHVILEDIHVENIFNIHMPTNIKFFSMYHLCAYTPTIPELVLGRDLEHCALNRVHIEKFIYNCNDLLDLIVYSDQNLTINEIELGDNVHVLCGHFPFNDTFDTIPNQIDTLYPYSLSNFKAGVLDLSNIKYLSRRSCYGNNTIKEVTINNVYLPSLLFYSTNIETVNLINTKYIAYAALPYNSQTIVLPDTVECVAEGNVAKNYYVLGKNLKYIDLFGTSHGITIDTLVLNSVNVKLSPINSGNIINNLIIGEDVEYLPNLPCTATSLEIPSSVTHIEGFDLWTNLQTLIIPESVTQIDKFTFKSSVKPTITINSDLNDYGDIKYMTIVNKEIYNGGHYIKDNLCYVNPDDIKRLYNGVFTIKEGCKKIAFNLYYNEQSIPEIIIPNTVEYILPQIIHNDTIITIAEDNPNYYLDNDSKNVIDKRTDEIVMIPFNGAISTKATKLADNLFRRTPAGIIVARYTFDTVIIPLNIRYVGTQFIQARNVEIYPTAPNLHNVCITCEKLNIYSTVWYSFNTLTMVGNFEAHCEKLTEIEGVNNLADSIITRKIGQVLLGITNNNDLRGIRDLHNISSEDEVSVTDLIVDYNLLYIKNSLPQKIKTIIFDKNDTMVKLSYNGNVFPQNIQIGGTIYNSDNKYQIEHLYHIGSFINMLQCDIFRSDTKLEGYLDSCSAEFYGIKTLDLRNIKQDLNMYTTKIYNYDTYNTLGTMNILINDKFLKLKSLPQLNTYGDKILFVYDNTKENCLNCINENEGFYEMCMGVFHRNTSGNTRMSFGVTIKCTDGTVYL